MGWGLGAGGSYLGIVVQGRQHQEVDVQPDGASPVGGVMLRVTLAVQGAAGGEGCQTC